MVDNAHEYHNIKKGFKFGDVDEQKLCRVEKVDVSSTFIENIFWSGLTLVSSNDIITIKINKKNHKKINKQKRLFKIKIWAVKWT